MYNNYYQPTPIQDERIWVQNEYAADAYLVAPGGFVRLLDALNANKVEALKDRIAEQNQQINALQLSASQAKQNAYLIDQLGTKCPIPAYLTCNPNAPLNYSVNYGCGCNA